MSAPHHSVIPEVLFKLFGEDGGGSGAVDSVNGKTGPVVLEAEDVGALRGAALTSTWELTDDLEVGVGGGVDSRIQVLPTAVDGGWVTVYQCKFEGDDFPRLVLVSDGSIFIGDGTTNPLQGDVSGLIPDGNGLRIAGNGSQITLKDGTIHFSPGDNALHFGGYFYGWSFIVGNNAEPDDSLLVGGQHTVWLDDTPGSTALKIKAKDSAGTVRAATIALT